MRITDILKKRQKTISFEVFPPKTTASYESVRRSVMEIAAQKPDFLSVTYGAGGGTSLFTARLAMEVSQNYGIPTMAHLSCISSTRDMVGEQLRQIMGMGIENILALRGDQPEGLDLSRLDYHYASDLVKEIHNFYDFCIGGACYPEGHPESETLYQDIAHVRDKVNAGCEFLITQMFFDNDLYYRYVELLREAGVRVPVIPGIMPITSLVQVQRARELSGTRFPARFIELIERYGEDEQSFASAGIEYAIQQAQQLRSHGVLPIHIYTMNKPQIANTIREALG